MRWGRPTSAVLITVSTLLLLSSCGSQDQAPTLEENLQRAREYKGFQVLWAGNSYGGLPLTNANFSFGGRRSAWTFNYGECKQIETSCIYGASISNSSICSVKPEKGNRFFRFRGTWAAFGPRLQGFLVVFTGRTVVTVEGDRDETLRLARALRPVRSSQSVRALEPPVKGGLTGDLPCQRNSGVDPG